MANTQVNISANGTTTLATAGKYCDRNIDVNVNVPSTGTTPTGTIEITTNGTHDVSDYASATVNVQSSGITPIGTKEITTNGTHDVTNYASAEVNVAETPTSFTNILTHASTVINLNANHQGTARNGAFAVIIDLAALGITTQKSLYFRMRGLWVDMSWAGIYGTADKSTWAARKTITNLERDEYGDCMVKLSSHNPTTYPYLALVFRHSASAITESAYAGSILTIDEAIGNGGYVG